MEFHLKGTEINKLINGNISTYLHKMDMKKLAVQSNNWSANAFE